MRRRSLAPTILLGFPGGATTISEFEDVCLELAQGRGAGYAESTQEELRFIQQVCEASGVLLDPVYTGKAFYKFVETVRADPGRFRDTDVLFWHTGGGLGMYAKADQLTPLLAPGKVCRLNVPGGGRAAKL